MQHTTISLIAATFFIALTHAIMPTHWMPFALIGRGQKWSLTKTVFVTAAAGLGHSLITSILGSVIALFGSRMVKYVETIAEPLSGFILIAIGIIFILIGRLRSTPHDHNHTAFSDKGIIISLFLMLSCSPCVALLPLFLAASTFSWTMLLVLSMVLSVTTVSGMLGLTVLTYKGVNKLHICSIERYEKEIIGGILILIGILFLIIH